MDGQAFDDTVILDVLGQDFFHVFFGFGGIPDVVGIDHHRWSMFAGVEASGFVHSHFCLKTTVVDALFQMVQKIG